MSNSQSSSQSNTFTETRAKYVLGKIYDDFCAVEMRGFHQFGRNSSKLQEWKEDLFFIMKHEDLNYFQLQFSYGTPLKNVALQYTIQANGEIHSDNDSGGINYFVFPANTKISIVVKRYGNSEVAEYLKSRGWGTNGKFVTGASESAGAYSKEGYGTKREKYGEWEK